MLLDEMELLKIIREDRVCATACYLLMFYAFRDYWINDFELAHSAIELSLSTLLGVTGMYYNVDASEEKKELKELRRVRNIK